MSTEQWSDWIPVDDAAKMLGVSVSTLKRRCRDSLPVLLPSGRSVEIQGERVQRPQGWMWQVRMPTDLPTVTSDQPQDDSEEAAAVSSDQTSAQTAQEPATASTVPSGVYVALVADVRGLERENGSLRAERDAETARASDLAARLTAAEEELKALANDLEREQRRSWLDKLLGRWPPA